MKRIGTVICVCLLLWGLLCPLTAAAQPTWAHTVVLEDADKAPLDEIAVFFCRVADRKENTYVPAEGFENSGLSMPSLFGQSSAASARQLLHYVREHELAALSAVSKNGRVTMSGLVEGIWLVYCAAEGAYVFDPYLLVLPSSGEAALTATPKMQGNTQNSKTVAVRKVWEDRDNAAGKRPANVTVILKNGDAVVDSVTLSEKNGWTHLFVKLPKDGTYTVEEQAVEHYTAAYNGDSENGFVITNTYQGDKLPQTGQIWWPVAVLGLAGAACVLLGLLELRGKKHENTAE